jgi:Sec7-like guanine-nucleotide exchange factor
MSLAEIANEDAAYVLAYSVIMLNTDLHNPQNRVSVLHALAGKGADLP